MHAKMSALCHRTEQIDLPCTKVTLRQAVARLSRCRKPRTRTRHEKAICIEVHNLIREEWILLQGQQMQQGCRKRYVQNSNEYAKLACRHICEKMQRKLPRELRDIIYKHILGGRSVILAPSSSLQEGRTALPRLPQLTDPHIHCVLSKVPAFWFESETADTHHVFDYRFASYDTVYELAQAWYRETTFITHDAKLLRPFLAADTWLLNLDIAKLVRNVVLRIPESAVRTTAIEFQLFRQNRRDWLRITTVPGRDNRALGVQLAHLNIFGPLTKLVLHIVPGPDYTRDGDIHFVPVEVWRKYQASIETLLDGLKQVWRVLSKLEELGREVELCLDAKGKCDITRGNAVWSPLGWLMRTMDWGLQEHSR
tara:strand:+ start:154 stop:1257 length:1104 start_codon:yes stop_codon:yes gene_type:complete